MAGGLAQVLLLLLLLLLSHLHMVVLVLLRRRRGLRVVRVLLLPVRLVVALALDPEAVGVRDAAGPAAEAEADRGGDAAGRRGRAAEGAHSGGGGVAELELV